MLLLEFLLLSDGLVELVEIDTQFAILCHADGVYFVEGLVLGTCAGTPATRDLVLELLDRCDDLLCLMRINHLMPQPTLFYMENIRSWIQLYLLH